MKVQHSSVSTRNTRAVGKIKAAALGDMQALIRFYYASSFPLVINKKSFSGSCRASNKNKEKKSYLSLDVMKKMIHELLHNKKMTKPKLAKVLKIDIEDLNKLISQERVEERLMAEINLSLIELYCGTKFSKKLSIKAEGGKYDK